MLTIQMYTAISKEKGQYVGINSAMGMIGQTHYHKNIVNLAKWADGGNCIKLITDKIVKQDVNKWLKLRARSNKHWQMVNSLQNRLKEA